MTNLTTNSYKRLVPGYEAPVNLAYSSRNRSAAIRIPMYSASPKAKRIEFRTPDPSCNGYLAFSAIMMAVIDGIENKIDPGDPLDKKTFMICRRKNWPRLIPRAGIIGPAPWMHSRMTMNSRLKEMCSPRT
ncbi:MAG: hypothetical protein R2861_10580 [Desulfobacterales bacterium]